MVNRDNGYQERQMWAAVQTVVAEFVNNGFTVIDVGVDQKPLFPGGRLFTGGHFTLQNSSHPVVVRLTSPDGVAVVYEPGVYATNNGQVVERRIKVIAVNTVESLIVDYGGL